MQQDSSLWLRWAISRTASVRTKLRDVTGIYNQWPIIVIGSRHHLPIDRLPSRPHCLANDNWTADQLIELTSGRD